VLRHGFDERGFGQGVGLVLFTKAARSASKSDCDSVGRTRKAPVKPWRVLFKAEMAFPTSLLGPEDNFAFSRFAWSCDSVDILGMLLCARVSLAGARSEAPGVGRVFRARAIEFFVVL